VRCFRGKWKEIKGGKRKVLPGLSPLGGEGGGSGERRAIFRAMEWSGDYAFQTKEKKGGALYITFGGGGKGGGKGQFSFREGEKGGGDLGPRRTHFFRVFWVLGEDRQGSRLKGGGFSLWTVKGKKWDDA